MKTKNIETIYKFKQYFIHKNEKDWLTELGYIYSPLIV